MTIPTLDRDAILQKLKKHKPEFEQQYSVTRIGIRMLIAIGGA